MPMTPNILPQINHAGCGPVTVCTIPDGTAKPRRVITCTGCGRTITDARELTPRITSRPRFASNDARRVNHAFEIIDHDQRAWER